MEQHDRLFKQLLTTFFIEFLQLFFPEVLEYLDQGSVEFLDKEIFTDITSGDRHEVDLVVKVKFKGQDAFFVIHVETQSTAMGDFPRRMFCYFARLHAKYGLPVYPIALFSFDKPLRREPRKYEVAFPDETILRFRYKVVQLNRLNWRQYARSHNPIAGALMAKMRIAAKDRPKVKLQCLRLIATLRLDPAKMELIRGFVSSYLKLNPPEQRRLEEELARLDPAEKETVMKAIDEWDERGMLKGMEKGRREGQERLVLRLLRHRFGPIPEELSQSIHALPSALLEELAEALLDFDALADAQAWIARHQP